MKSDLKIRTKDYALSVIRLFAELPKKTETQIMGRQLLRCGTSVGAKTLEARGRHHLRSFRRFENSRTWKFPSEFLFPKRLERSEAVERLERFERAQLR